MGRRKKSDVEREADMAAARAAGLEIPDAENVETGETKPAPNVAFQGEKPPENPSQVLDADEITPPNDAEAEAQEAQAEARKRRRKLTPWKARDLMPMVKGGYRQVGKFRGYPEQWTLGDEQAEMVADRIVAVAAKYSVFDRFAEEIQLAVAVALTTYGCLYAEEMVKEAARKRMAGAAPAESASKS